MDELSTTSSGARTGAKSHALAWILLALALAGVFCWRVATTDPRWNGGAAAAGAGTRK